MNDDAGGPLVIDHRRADLFARPHRQVDRVVVYGERADWRAVRPLQILPFPAAAEPVAVEITFVADQVAFDALHAGRDDSIGESVDAFEVISVVESRGDRRIAATVDDQIAFDLSIVIQFSFA